MRIHGSPGSERLNVVFAVQRPVSDDPEAMPGDSGARSGTLTRASGDLEPRFGDPETVFADLEPRSADGWHGSDRPRVLSAGV